MSAHAIARPDPLTSTAIGASSRRRILIGVAVIIASFGGFGAWAALAPLNSAAIAPGALVVDSHVKTVQHLEGGIIKEIFVGDGATVAAGQVLLRLDDTRVRASVDQLTGQYRAARALEARLLAERDGAREIAFPDDLLAVRDNPDVDKAIAGQRALFAVRRDTLAGDIAIQHQRIAQFNEEIIGLDAQRNSADGQLALLKEEIQVVEALLLAGQERKPRLLALQRARRQIEGDRGRFLASIARAKQSIGETQLQVSQLSVMRLKEATDELREVQIRIFDLRERLRAAEDTLDKMTLRAPQAGTVVRMSYFTLGGVIAAGQPILDIVPADDQLMVEARVRPEDIDTVRLGMSAEIRLDAFNQRRMPLLLGRVVQVSADRLTDRRTDIAYFTARVELDRESVKLVPGGAAALFPGMPAEVIIETGQRTALDYFVAPIARSLSRGFRED
jgi:HlyD family type I secretion membrane fusion protein